MENEEELILKFINQNSKKTVEEIKKALRKKFPDNKFYNDEVEDYIIKAISKSKNNDYER